MTYLDNAATTKPFDEASNITTTIMQNIYANPSSVHTFGRQALDIVKNAKKTLASVINANENEIIFTSGGTESINTAIFSAALKLSKRGKHIIATEIEHSATINVLKELRNRGFEVDFIKVNSAGNIDIETFKKAIRPDTILASCMLVNNEIGSILPIKEMITAFKDISKFGLFHVDAVQGLMKTDIDVCVLNADLMSFSAHKIHGPKGVGALFVKKGVNIPPYIYGGGQQNDFRSGTENVSGIAGFAKALEIYKNNCDTKHIQMLADYLDEMLVFHFSDDNFCYNGKSDTPYIRNFSIPNLKSEVCLRVLESHEVFVSSGSACSKGKISYVLLNMGIDKNIADASLRVSFSCFNTKDDINLLIRGLTECVNMFKK